MTDITDVINQISQRIIKSAYRDSKGAAWHTLHATPKGGYEYMITNTFYSGTSGIVFFLLQSLRLGKGTDIENLIISGADHIFSQLGTAEQSPAFLTGYLGEMYVLSQIDSEFNEKQYKEKIISMIDRVKEDASMSGLNEYISGKAGILVGLLAIYDTYRDDRILEAIDIILAKLLQGMYVTDKGVYWDRSGKNIRGLCGFSHGASGVAFTLLELGRYFYNPALCSLAEEAFEYEDQWYSEEEMNWADWRKGVWDGRTEEEYAKAYERNDLAFFTKPKYMSAWCHGAPGIGLARIRAYDVLKKERYREDALKALRRIEKDDPAGYRSYALCHGGAGNAETFIYMYQVTQDEQYLHYPQVVAQEISKRLERKELLQSGIAQATVGDTSLFMGTAGIGYFLLRLMDPFHTPSILCPIISSPGIQIDSNYPALSISSERLEEMKEEKRKIYTHPFVHRIEKGLVSDAYTSYDQTRMYRTAQKQAALGEQDFSELKLTWGEYATYEERDGAHILIKYTPEQVVHLEVSEFCARVMKHFKHITSVHSVVQALCTEYKAEGEKEKEYVAHQAREQIKQLMLYGALE